MTDKDIIVEETLEEEVIIDEVKDEKKGFIGWVKKNKKGILITGGIILASAVLHVLNKDEESTDDEEWAPNLYLRQDDGGQYSGTGEPTRDNEVEVLSKNAKVILLTDVEETQEEA